MVTVVIEAASGVTFLDSTNIVIGTGPGTTVLLANINSATQQSATGTLKTALTGASTDIIITTGPGVTFATTADVVVGSTNVLHANINTANDS